MQNLSKSVEDSIRSSAFLWLKQKSELNGGIFNRQDLLTGFRYSGMPVTLIGPAGIWFPKGFNIPISITTTSSGPYNDGFTEDGFLEYKYRGMDANHRDNIGLENACITRTPLIYFHSIKPGKYVAVWPVSIIENDPANLTVRAAIDPAYNSLVSNISKSILSDSPESVIGIRKYITAMTRQRLHQSAFRELVLDAYSRQCTMCKLQHPELLDAAHIIPDSEDDGLPVIRNGLSLCKIHHAAYDRDIIGITPDYVIKVREDILYEVDGPMLKYGLQSLNNNKIILPKHKTDYPDKERLERRFAQFIA